jgi:hypothetical protein
VIWSSGKDEEHLPRIIGIRFTEIAAADRLFLDDVAGRQFEARMTTP